MEEEKTVKRKELGTFSMGSLIDRHCLVNSFVRNRSLHLFAVWFLYISIDIGDMSVYFW